jgi:hypothetical protein
MSVWWSLAKPLHGDWLTRILNFKHPRDAAWRSMGKGSEARTRCVPSHVDADQTRRDISAAFRICTPSCSIAHGAVLARAHVIEHWGVQWDKKLNKGICKRTGGNKVVCMPARNKVPVPGVPNTLQGGVCPNNGVVNNRIRSSRAIPVTSNPTSGSLGGLRVQGRVCCLQKVVACALTKDPLRPMTGGGNFQSRTESDQALPCYSECF